MQQNLIRQAVIKKKVSKLPKIKTYNIYYVFLVL